MSSTSIVESVNARCSISPSTASCGCDGIKIKIGELVIGGHVRTRAIVVQLKTGRPVQFEIMDDALASLPAWLERPGGALDDYAFPSRVDHVESASPSHQVRALLDEDRSLQL